MENVYARVYKSRSDKFEGFKTKYITELSGVCQSTLYMWADDEESVRESTRKKIEKAIQILKNQNHTHEN